MAEVRYLEEFSERDTLRLYVDRKTNRFEFERDEAERIARKLADRGCYVRVEFGSSVLSEFGENPLR